jgi:hypothetical protein
MDALHNGMLNARVLQFLDGLWSGKNLSLVSTFVSFQKLQNSQSDDGGRSTEEEEVVNDISRNLCNLQSYVYSL